MRFGEAELLEGSVPKGAAQVYVVECVGFSNVAFKCLGGPDGGGGEESGEYGLGVAEDGTADDGGGGAAKGSDRGGLFGGVSQPLAGDGGFDFEDGVDAFGGDVQARGMWEQQGRIEIVKDGDVDLAAAAAIGVDYEGGGGAVALGEIAVKEVDPMLFGGGAVGSGMFEDSAGGEVRKHLMLDAEEDLAEIDAAGVFVGAHARFEGKGIGRGWRRCGTGRCCGGGEKK